MTKRAKKVTGWTSLLVCVALVLFVGAGEVAASSQDSQQVSTSDVVPPGRQNRALLRPSPPELGYFRNITSSTTFTIGGTAFGATQVRGTGPGGSATAPVSPRGSFTLDIPLLENRANRIELVASQPGVVESSPTFAEITRDNQDPWLIIDSHVDGDEVLTESVTVFGRVGDVLAGNLGLDVTVNGAPAIVDLGLGNNGTFVLENVQLPLGQPFDIVFEAQDRLHNGYSETITLVRQAPSREFISVVSGDGQNAAVNTELGQPIVARVTDAAGVPFPDKLVVLEVTQSDGLLGVVVGSATERALQLRTNANGEVRAFWKLGSDAGCGNNRVVARSTSVQGEARFMASGDAGVAVQVNLGSGSNQRVETGAIAPHPLVAWVSDSCNATAGVGVEFSVASGGGLVRRTTGALPGPWVSQVVVPTDDTGHASVLFQAPPSAAVSIVEARFPGFTGNSTAFVIQTLAGASGAAATFRGIVVNNAQQPLEGAACELVVAGAVHGSTTTNTDGCFEFTGITGFGASELTVEGGSVIAVHTASGPLAPLGAYPRLHFETEVIAGADNSLGMTVLLPELQLENARTYSVTEDTILTVDGIDDLEMRVHAGSMTIHGQPAAHGTPISLDQVHHDDIPMPMPDGVAPLFAWTLQPGGAHFDPPVEITYPNMAGLSPGAVAYFLSFDHDLGRFVIVASGSVVGDGSVVRTAIGEGLTVAGWGCNCPPYSVTARCDGCDTRCVNPGSLMGGSFTGPSLEECYNANSVLHWAVQGYVDSGGGALRVCPNGGSMSIPIAPTTSIAYRWELTGPNGFHMEGAGASASIQPPGTGAYACRIWGSPDRQCGQEQLLGSSTFNFLVPHLPGLGAPQVSVPLLQWTGMTWMAAGGGTGANGTTVLAWDVAQHLRVGITAYCYEGRWYAIVDLLEVVVTSGPNPRGDWFIEDYPVPQSCAGLAAQVQDLVYQTPLRSEPGYGFFCVFCLGGPPNGGDWALRAGVSAHEREHFLAMRQGVTELAGEIAEALSWESVPFVNYPTEAEAVVALREMYYDDAQWLELARQGIVAIIEPVVDSYQGPNRGHDPVMPGGVGGGAPMRAQWAAHRQYLSNTLCPAIQQTPLCFLLQFCNFGDMPIVGF